MFERAFLVEEEQEKEMLLVGLTKENKIFFSEVEKDFIQFFELHHIYDTLPMRKIEGRIFDFKDFEV